MILVYVTGPDNARAAESIAHPYNKAVSQAEDRPVFILGDFNSCDISEHLPNLEQFVTFPTRNKRTLDKCYSNIPNAFDTRRRPPFGKSDHCCTCVRVCVCVCVCVCGRGAGIMAAVRSIVC